VSDLSRLGRAYQRKTTQLLDTDPNARAQRQLHSIDDMIVTDLAHTYPMATGREVQQAMVEGSPHLHERKAGHVDDYTRRTLRKVWEGLGREPEPWMRAEGGRGGRQGQGPGPGRGGAGGIGRTAATMLEALMQEQGHPGHGRGADRDDVSSGDR